MTWSLYVAVRPVSTLRERDQSIQTPSQRVVFKSVGREVGWTSPLEDRSREVPHQPSVYTDAIIMASQSSQVQSDNNNEQHDGTILREGILVVNWLVVHWLVLVLVYTSRLLLLLALERLVE